MRLGLISDTHGVLHTYFIDILKTCDYIIHAGDFDTEDCYETLLKLGIPMYAVRGNCDDSSWAQSLPHHITFELGGKHFYLIHNRNQISFSREPVNIVVYGHTHHYDISTKHNVTYINPGSAGSWRGEPLGMVLLEISDDGVVSSKHVTM